MNKNNLKEILICVLTAIFSWTFFIVFLYSANVKEVSIIEAGTSFLIFSVCALLSVLIGLILYRTISIASIFSIALAVLLTNFSLFLSAIQHIIPQIRYWHLFYIDIVLAVLLSGFLKKFANINHVVLAIKVICVVYIGLIAINSITAAPTIIRKIKANQNTALQQNEPEIQNGQSDGTNIYYLLCDEYASFEQLKQECGFENAEFRDYLTQKKFNISDNSSNFASATYVVLSNLMSLDYVANSNTTTPELNNFCQNGVLHSILTEHGYTGRGIGETAWLGFEGTVNSQSGAQTADGENFTTTVLKNTFLAVSIQDNRSASAKKIVDSLNDLVNMPIAPNSSEFVMMYIRAPHHPYYFRKDGSMNMPSKYNNVDGTNWESYVGEIEWLNGYLEKGINHIIESDPECIIVLCSDHGNRFGNKYRGFSQKILNAVYYKGEELDEIKDLSGINTIKYILNNELGTALEYTENPTAN